MNNNKRYSHYILLSLRLQKGISQKQLAEVLGISRSHYCSVEKGIRPLSKHYAELLADFYELPLEKFEVTEKGVLENLEFLEEHIDILNRYLADEEMEDMCQKMGINVAFVRLLCAMKYTVGLYPDGLELASLDGIWDKYYALDKENVKIVASIVRNNSNVVYFDKAALEQFHEELLEYAEFIVNRYINKGEWIKEPQRPKFKLYKAFLEEKEGRTHGKHQED